MAANTEPQWYLEMQANLRSDLMKQMERQARIDADQMFIRRMEETSQPPLLSYTATAGYASVSPSNDVENLNITTTNNSTDEIVWIGPTSTVNNIPPLSLDLHTLQTTLREIPNIHQGSLMPSEPLIYQPYYPYPGSPEDKKKMEDLEAKVKQLEDEVKKHEASVVKSKAIGNQRKIDLDL